ncbi:hypothetical protein KY290_031211 [Solanum tuberosum]|uniref:Integrase core domain containing protein n=1 Tax=Solanum tuberosum TaxID=4113 RepID=A0ABQ7U8S7_SOLTU|nr:hypothetical protein KY290_031211 [Solanum tuberosum]
MVRNLEKQKSIKFLKSAKVKVHHYRKPRRLVILEEFLPSSFCTKSTQDNVKASCFNANKEETMKASPTDKEGTKSESSPKVSPSDEEGTTREISSMMSPWYFEKPIEPSSQELHVCDTKITFIDNDILFGSGVNILPINTLKELGITTEELSESHLLIQGFNQGGQRTCVRENKIVSSSYYQCLKHLEGGIERKIVAVDDPFTEVDTHFDDAKFYLKSYIVKGTKYNDVKSIKSNEITSKRIDVAVKKVKIDTKAPCPIVNEGNIMSLKKKLTSVFCYVPKVKK